MDMVQRWLSELQGVPEGVKKRFMDEAIDVSRSGPACMIYSVFMKIS